MRRILLVLFLSLLTVGLVGCGGGGSSSPGGGGNNNQPSISVSPTSATLLAGQSTTLTANVQNVSDSRVAWSVEEANGGTVTSTDAGGVYTAPWPVGTYHVVATSVSNPSLTARATLSVSAAFAFMEEYPEGSALPVSMTPKIGIFEADGTFTTAGYLDQGNPISVALGSLVLSSDGTKAAMDIVSVDGYPDVYTASADGSDSPLQLTTDGLSMMPEFSPDGQQIVYIRDFEIWAMAANGSNQHVVLPGNDGEIYAHFATYSPDGAKIAAELEWSPGGTPYDGIAIMNADGSNAVPLTGGPDFTCNSGWDETPAFTHDGTQIVFSRHCPDNETSTLYTVNVDGTGLTALYPIVETPGVVAYHPIPVADTIVFQSNEDSPYSVSQFDIYSIKPGDGGTMELSRLMTNSLYDGFDCNLYYSCGAAVAQQSVRPSVQTLSQPAPRGLHNRAERVRSQQQRHRR